MNDLICRYRGVVLLLLYIVFIVKYDWDVVHHLLIYILFYILHFQYYPYTIMHHINKNFLFSHYNTEVNYMIVSYNDFREFINVLNNLDFFSPKSIGKFNSSLRLLNTKLIFISQYNRFPREGVYLLYPSPIINILINQVQMAISIPLTCSDEFLINNTSHILDSKRKFFQSLLLLNKILFLNSTVYKKFTRSEFESHFNFFWSSPYGF